MSKKSENPGTKRGPNRTPAERAIIFAAVLGGLTLDELNVLLPPTTRKVPESSYQMMRNTYFEAFVKAIGTQPSQGKNGFGKMLDHPPPMSGLE